MGRGQAENLYILYTKKLLCKLAGEFYQDPIRAAIGVPKQGYNNVTVVELKKY
jgi:hypothetical protein